MALRLRIECRRPPFPLPRFFSSSSLDDNDEDKDPQPSSISSHFRDVKATLKHQHSEDHPLRRQTPRPSFLSRNQRQQQLSPESLEEIQKRLSGFRNRVAPPPSPSAPSFQKFYLQNDLSNKDNIDSARNAAKVSLDGIKESLRGISDRMNASSPGRDGLGSSGGDRMSLSRFTETLRLRPEEVDKAAPRKNVGGGGKGEALPWGIFGKEIKEKKEAKAGKQNDSLEKTKFLRSYEYEELGEKLRMLRNPADVGMKGFSLEELNERLVRLKEMEEKEMESKSKNTYWSGLREALLNIKLSEDEKARTNTVHRLDILGSLGGTPIFMRHPPKEHLFEKYFHPDNISSSEKLKIQLAKVREEFKMSESDCGSARVQVAQLTTKIKHLSSVLHKKDKHSRKGLEEMVQRRKRLLKYLRDTDWDSYTMVLSRLGLRDNNAVLRR